MAWLVMRQVNDDMQLAGDEAIRQAEERNHEQLETASACRFEGRLERLFLKIPARMSCSRLWWRQRCGVVKQGAGRNA